MKDVMFPRDGVESEYAPYYDKYVKLFDDEHVTDALAAQTGELATLVLGIQPDGETHRYAPDKWSIREVFGHLADCERVFGYRLFRIARGDETPLAGFDETHYAARSDANGRMLSLIVREFSVVREANLDFMRRLTDEEWRRIGTANEKQVSARALALIMGGHVRHHMNILRERYGVGRTAQAG